MLSVLKNFFKRLNVYNLALFLAFYLGIIIGSVYLLFSSRSSSQLITELFDNYYKFGISYNFFELFIREFFLSGTVFFLIFIVGLSLVGKIAVFPIMAFLGGYYGTVFALVYSYLGERGIVPALVCLLPTALLNLLLYHGFLIRTAIMSDNVIKNSYRSELPRYFKHTVKAAALSVIPIIYDCISVLFIFRKL